MTSGEPSNATTQSPPSKISPNFWPVPCTSSRKANQRNGMPCGAGFRLAPDFAELCVRSPVGVAREGRSKGHMVASGNPGVATGFNAVCLHEGQGTLSAACLPRIQSRSLEGWLAVQHKADRRFFCLFRQRRDGVLLHPFLPLESELAEPIPPRMTGLIPAMKVGIRASRRRRGRGTGLRRGRRRTTRRWTCDGKRLSF